MKKLQKICALGLLAVFIAGGVFGGWQQEVYAAQAWEDITSDSIEAKKDEVANAQKEQTDIKNSISNISNIISGLQAQKADLNKYIAGLDSSMADIQSNIAYYEALVTQKENEITEKEAELEYAKEQEQAHYIAMQQHIQYMYECGTSSYLEAIFQADSFADILNRAEYIEEIASYDDRLLEAYVLYREYIEVFKESLEAEKVTLNESKSALEAEKGNLAVIRDQKAADLAEFEDSISITQAQLKELEADLKYQTDLIASLEKEITAEQKEILKQNGVDLGYDGKGFACPAPSYTRISSDFGWRSDPFTGLKAYHNGIDMAAAEGTPIVAAFDGIVGQAGYNGSMGNYIYLEHGDGLRTIYLHASKLYVSKDDVVKKGDVIAAVGSTGRSTGPHLHFSVRLNGEYVSPWNYLSR